MPWKILKWYLMIWTLTDYIPVMRVGNGTHTYWIWFLAWLQVFLHNQEQISFSVLYCGLIAKENKLNSALFKSEAKQMGELTCHSCPQKQRPLNIYWGDKKW